MPSSNILPFAVTDTGTNLLTDAAYAADSQRTIGHQPGIARSKLENKALRQTSLIAAGVGQFLANHQANNITDAETVAHIAAWLADAVASIAGSGAIAQSASRGSAANLQLSATGLSAVVSVSADEIVLESAAFNYITARNVVLSVAGTSVGINALDAGTIAGDTWYSIWVIWNGTTVAGLMSLSAVTPTLPAGYTHKARVGWIRTDGPIHGGVDTFPFPFKQFGNRVQYMPNAGLNLTLLPVIAENVAGAIINETTYAPVAVPIAGSVPPTAGVIDVLINPGGPSGGALASATPGYRGVYTSSAPPGSSWGASGVASIQAGLVINGANIYVIAQYVTSAIRCMGWTDSL